MEWLALAASLCAPPLAAAQELPAGAVLVALEAQGRSFDQLSEGDTRPQARGELGARIDLGYLLTNRWAVTLSGHFGGSWFAFKSPPATAGNIKDVSWSGRVGLDRVFSMADGKSVVLGAGFEYGEARSWLKNLFLSDEGPHAYLAGGSIRAGASGPLWRRYQLIGQINQSFYRAHARDASTRSDYDWIGRSLAVTVGVRLVLGGR